MNKFYYPLDSRPIQYLCSKDKRLSKVILSIGSLVYTVHEDSFAFLAHEIVEQMLSVQAGNIIYSRLVSLCNGTVTPSHILSLSPEDIKTTGMSYKKVHCLIDLAQDIENGVIKLDSFPSMTDAEIIKTLTHIKGIGSWTSKMYLIFVLNRLDVLPYEDGAFLQSYRWLYNTSDCSHESIKKRCKKWRPYSSIAARYMYRALDSGMTKSPFHLYK